MRAQFLFAGTSSCVLSRKKWRLFKIGLSSKCSANCALCWHCSTSRSTCPSACFAHCDFLLMPLFFIIIFLGRNGWAGYLGQSHLAAMEQSIRLLLSDIRPNAVALVDAFEFSDGTLNSALGKHDGNVYEALYASAKANPINQKVVFDGFEHLQTVLDKDFIKEHAKMMSPPAPVTPSSKL